MLTSDTIAALNKFCSERDLKWYAEFEVRLTTQGDHRHEVAIKIYPRREEE
jgi:hypothetical protein